MIESFTLPFPTDYLVIFAIFAASSFWAFQGGGIRVAAAVLAFPMTLFVFERINGAAILGEQLELLSEMPYITMAVFVITFLLMYLLVRSITNDYGGINGLVLQSLLLGLATTAMMLATWHSLPFLTELWQFSGHITAFFVPEFILGWMAVSFVLVYIAAQRL